MIILTPHALLKLKQRGIKRSFVIKAINKIDFQKSSHSDRTIIYKKFGRLYLKVIFKKENLKIIVITQYWVKKI